MVIACTHSQARTLATLARSQAAAAEHTCVHVRTSVFVQAHARTAAQRNHIDAWHCTGNLDRTRTVGYIVMAYIVMASMAGVQDSDCRLYRHGLYSYGLYGPGFRTRTVGYIGMGDIVMASMGRGSGLALPAI